MTTEQDYQTSGVLTRQAPAKLNLALAVGPPNEVGMHPICSWMVTIDLCDELSVKRLPAGRLSRYAILWHEQARRRTDIDWSIRHDLAVRAHLALEQHFGRPLPIQLKLEKRIPVGGGLGGGSSDAAAMLRAVNDLYELGMSSSDLTSIASSLGSDVAFFIEGGSAIVEGLGERVTQCPAPDSLHAVLVFPPLQCNTGEVYRAFDTLGSEPLRQAEVRSLIEGGGGPDAHAALLNDLAEAAMTVAPELRTHHQAVSELAERTAGVAGSGSTLFVICDDSLHAEALAGAIEKRLDLPAVAVTRNSEL